MRRFFVSPDKVLEGKICIDTDDVSHIIKVLRLTIGDKVIICDSLGTDYISEITEILDKKIICTINKTEKSDTEPNIYVTLYQALPKQAKMEYIIQKTTELGISKIVPVSLSRCVSKIEDKKSEKKKLERWNKIAKEASKQSGRGIIPEVCSPINIDKAIELMKNDDLSFVPYECEEKSTLKPVLLEKKEIKNVSFLIGPEGGFDLSEIEKIKKENIPTISLGKRILRTETAGEAVLSMVMYEIGDLN